MAEVVDRLPAHKDLSPNSLSVNVFVNTLDELKGLARRVGGRLEKKSSPGFLYLRKRFTGGICLDLVICQEKVCSPTITRKVLPAVPAQPEREVEEITWECPESLFDQCPEVAPSARG